MRAHSGSLAKAVSWCARVMPKSSNDAIETIEATAEVPAFRARVRAVPADGEANSRVQLVAGAKSRVKSFAVTGETARLEAILVRKSAALAPLMR